MSAAENFLSRLEGVRRTGDGRWIARCPAHDDRSPSLSVSEKEDGRILIRCHAECSAHEIVHSVGLELSDLYPPRETGHRCKPERRPFPAADVLRCIAFEALVVCAASRTLQNGEPLSPVDHERLILAAERIQQSLTAAGVN